MSETYAKYQVKCANQTCDNKIDSDEMDKTGLCEACKKWIEEGKV